MSRNPSPGFRRRPRIADQMTPDLYACVDNAYRAERAGDFAEALEWHQSVPMFGRGRHTFMLGQLVDWGDDLPGWAWARIASYLAIRTEDGETGVLAKAVLRDTVEGVHGDLMQRCHDRGGDPIQVMATAMGESWVFHQRFAHDEGGAVTFLEEFATDRLAERCDLARSWAGAAMGGYRVGASRPGGLMTVTDLADDTSIDVLDLGAGLAHPGAAVVGRLVPSGVGRLLMFDMPPLDVPKGVAHRVARRHGQPWWEVLEDFAIQSGASGSLLREDYELASDVQGLDLLRLGTRPVEHDRVLRQLRAGRDEISRAAYRILMKASQADVAPTDQALVAAAVMYPKAFADSLRCRPAAGAWDDWVERVPEPARSRILALAATQ
jgi:hypothetical protein